MPQQWTIRRRVTGEIMDSSTLDPAEHRRALAALRRINRVSRTAPQILKPISEWARRVRSERLSLLDVACGGGDVPVEVAVGLEQRGIHVDLTLLDRSATALEEARSRADRAGITSRGVEADVLAQLPSCSVDVVTCTLFLHHLRQPEQVSTLLRNMKECARHLVIISDLRRSRGGLIAAWAGSRALSRSPIVHHDSVASVRAAWTRAELEDLARQAGMVGVRIAPCWPWRMLLVWERPAEA